MTRELIIERLHKIAALADRGVGGEKVNAKIQLEKLLEKHHVSLEDLNTRKPRRTNAFKYFYKWQRELLLNCYHCLMGSSSFEYYRAQKRKVLYFEMTALQEIELRDMFCYYKKLYAKELNRLALAFTHKHYLFNYNQNDSGDSSKELSKEEIAAIVRMMQGIEPSSYVSRNRSLT
jgi:hypothetical protein